MSRRLLIVCLFLSIAKVSFAQKDTLVYYLTANGDLAPSRQAAYCKLVVFPVGSGSGAKLSAIKAIGNDGKLIFSGSSNTHGFPVHAVGPFIQYDPDGAKMSVKIYSNGYATGDETDFYPNGNLKSSVKPNDQGDADKMEYFEDGTLQFEHHPSAGHQFDETYYYPGGKVLRKVHADDAGVASTEHYLNGQLKYVKTPGSKGEKTTEIAYFPNGNIHYKLERSFKRNHAGVLYVECRDSTGKVLAQNGNGLWVEYDQDFTFKSKQGKIANGLADSVWTILFWPNSGLHETYENGKLISSEGFKTRDTATGTAGERTPEFPGGKDGLNTFLMKYVRFPALARENNTTGTVVVSFIVEKDGALSDFKVVSGIGDGCDEEVIRVMKTSPPWTPGTKNGIPDRVEYVIPVHFLLSEDGHSGWITLETN